MPLLHLALQEGFVGDEVVIRIDGREVYRQSGVKTRLQIGRAAALEENVAAGSVAIELVLPQKNLSQSVAIQLEGDTYVGFSISQTGAVEHKISKEPFGYV